MRWAFCIALVLAFCGTVRADDEPKPEDLKRMYAATLDQLKDAQNRKAQLAAENAELEKQLAAANVQLAQLKQDSAQYAARTYFYRTQFFAWRQFIFEFPVVRISWDNYLDSAPPLVPALLIQLDDANWPLGGAAASPWQFYAPPAP